MSSQYCFRLHLNRLAKKIYKEKYNRDMLSMKQRLHLIAVSIGLFACYSLFGILQERIFRKGYANNDGTPDDHFIFSITFVCLQCIFYSFSAKGEIQRTLIHTKCYQSLIPA